MSLCHIVAPDSSVHLKKIDPDDTCGRDKLASVSSLEEASKRMEELFDLLYFAGQHALLIVLQGMDTSGKDGTIRHLMASSHAQSFRAEPFKVPTPEELAHDFLWRAHKVAPGRGGITIYNRSHYEDVLVVRVHNLVPKEIWSQRYDQINHYESLLASNNTIILKFYLHINKDEQEKRLLEREKEVEKSWKLSVGDWKEREFWDDYQEAYSDAMGKCSPKHAPWRIVSSNHKWFRNLAITEAIVETLEEYEKDWLKHLESVGAKAKEDLDLYRRGS